MSYLPCHYLCISFIYCTCWVPIISLLNLAIFSCYSNLLLRRRRCTAILRRAILGYVLPRLSFCGVMESFTVPFHSKSSYSLKTLFFVIIILYIRGIWLSVTTFGHMCGTNDPGSCIRWVLGFGIKTGYDRDAGWSGYEENRRFELDWDCNSCSGRIRRECGFGLGESSHAQHRDQCIAVRW
jgi:hypothetical protein